MNALSVKTLLAAFDLLGDRIGKGKPVSILVVGGAAGLLTGELHDRLTTEDVDVIAYLPPGSDSEIDDDSIRAVGKAMRFSASWFEDSQVRLKAVYLPADWRQRAVPIGEFGRLTVLAAGRLDLLAMKIGATRPKDRQDVLTMMPTESELDWINRFLDEISDRTEVTKAKAFLATLREN